MAKCITPVYIWDKREGASRAFQIPVPCGKCPNCINRRINQWAFRLQKESLEHKRQFFVTLTYDNENITFSNNGYYTLNPIDVTNFFKRLRKTLKEKTKYYYSGEYGTKNHRPHYHLILFGGDDLTEEKIIKAWINPKDGYMLGMVHFGDVTEASIKYTVGYITLKTHKNERHEDDDRYPEYSRMSKGLGAKFLSSKQAKYIIDRPSEQYLYSNGHKLAIPDYYKYKIFRNPAAERILKEHPSYALHADYLSGLLNERSQIAKQKSIEHENSRPQQSLHERNENREALIRNFRKKHKKARD